MQYVLLNQTDPVDIKYGPFELPDRWWDEDTKSVVDLSVLDDAELAALGWYPFQADNTLIEEGYEVVSDILYELVEGTVVETKTIVYVTLPKALEEKTNRINSYREDLIEDTMFWNGYQWDSDEKSRENITGVTSAIANGVPLPEGFTWRTSDNQDISLTAAEMIEFGVQMMNFVNYHYQKSWLRKNEVKQLATVQEVIDYDHEVLWNT